MSNGKSFLVDLTKCTTAAAARLPCKQWKKLPGEKTKNTGAPESAGLRLQHPARGALQREGNQRQDALVLHARPVPPLPGRALQDRRGTARTPSSSMKKPAPWSTTKRPPRRASTPFRAFALQCAEAGQEEQDHQQVRHVQRPRKGGANARLASLPAPRAP